MEQIQQFIASDPYMLSLPFVGDVLLAIGVFFMFTGAFGLFRMPDFYSRIHAAGMTDSGGIVFMLLGVMLHLPPGLVWFKVLILLLFGVAAGAAASHALAKAAFISGLPPMLDGQAQGEVAMQIEHIEINAEEEAINFAEQEEKEVLENGR